MKVEEKIALCAIKAHEKSHIELKLELCKQCEKKICIQACPAQLYSEDPDSHLLKVEHSGCLECGTCLIICPSGAVQWNYPEAGFGIRYRYG